MSIHPSRVFFGLCILTTVNALVLAAPLGPAITYQGRLTESGGPPPPTVNLEFRLFDAVTGGIQIGNPDVENSTPVVNGLFSVILNDAGQFGATAFNGDARWIEVRVNGIALSPRQPVTAAPYAHRAMGATGLPVDGNSLDAADGSPADAVFVNAGGQVGIHNVNPQTTLDIFDPISIVRLRGPSPNTPAGVLIFQHMVPPQPGLMNPPGSIVFQDNTGTEVGSIEMSGLAVQIPPAPTIPPQLLISSSVVNVDASSSLLLQAGGGATLLSENLLSLTSNNSAVRVRTGGATRMQVTDLGLVGIGTTDPQTDVHVFEDSGTARIRVETANGQAGVSFMSDSTVENVIYSPDNTDDLRLNVNGADRLAITSTGNVGIGTNSPAQKLDVAGTVQMTGLRLSTGAAAGRILSSDASGNGTWQTLSIDSPWTTNGSNISNTNTGNVGIGTGSPTQKLHVAGTVLMTGFRLSTGAAAGRVLTSDASGVGTWQAAAGGGGGQWENNGNNISNTNIGNVGVGTNTPLQKLDIAGGVAINGILIINEDGEWVGPAGPDPSTDAVCLNDHFNCSATQPSQGTVDSECSGICTSGFTIAAGGPNCNVSSDTGSCQGIASPCGGTSREWALCCVCKQ